MPRSDRVHLVEQAVTGKLEELTQFDALELLSGTAAALARLAVAADVESEVLAELVLDAEREAQRAADGGRA